jgi:hypothetical protein
MPWLQEMRAAGYHPRKLLLTQLLDLFFGAGRIEELIRCFVYKMTLLPLVLYDVNLLMSALLVCGLIPLL